MARPQSRFVCQACGDAVLRWEGQCRVCGAWNTLVETVVSAPPRPGRLASRGMLAVGDDAQTLRTIAERDVPRLPAGMPELDRVLGGGLVTGSLVLLGGEPGIGKSTLLLQIAAGLVRGPEGAAHVLYATGEESAGQVRLRAERLGLLDDAVADRVMVVPESRVERII